MTQKGSFHCDNFRGFAESLSQAELADFRGVCLGKVSFP